MVNFASQLSVPNFISIIPPEMSDIKPIKRHTAIQPLSREHHNGLVFCWRIRSGLSKNVELARIKTYVDWFWANHLQQHFEAEEKYVFPVLDNNDELLTRALDEHRILESLIANAENLTETLEALANTLEGHIRFEERILFNKIQDMATEEQLKNIFTHHDHEVTCEAWPDEFWKSNE
jgi:iron-sulfur cluster repair protein YtfE (RIC family)